MFTDLHKLSIDVPGVLSFGARPRGSDWLQKEITNWKKQGVEHLVCLLPPMEALQLGLRDEAFYAKENSIQFTNFEINHMGIPISIDDFLNLSMQLSQEILNGKWVHIHGRSGIGRSAILVCAILYFLGFCPTEAKKLSSESRRLQIPDTEEQDQFIMDIQNLVNKWDRLIHPA